MKNHIGRQFLAARFFETPRPQSLPQGVRRRVESCGLRDFAIRLATLPCQAARVETKADRSCTAQDIRRGRRERKTAMAGEIRQDEALRHQLTKDRKPAAAIELGADAKCLESIMLQPDNALGRFADEDVDEMVRAEALIGYCEAASCRRQVLLGYFGEADHPPCGNCDNCRTPVPSWDGTVAAQKALSAVYRTGQRFGAHHLVDILVGNATERIGRLKHDRLKTFGIGTELDRRGWLSVFRQLVAQGFILPDLAGHGGLALAPAAAEILRGIRTVRFRVDPRGPTRRSPKRDRKIAQTTELDPAARTLWEALRAWRLEEARRQELPPYVIFHDSTLLEVVRRRPISLTSLAIIPGVGASKLERYGSVIIGMVAQTTGDPEALCASSASRKAHGETPRPA